jgi:hypothetical protein
MVHFEEGPWAALNNVYYAAVGEILYRHLSGLLDLWCHSILQFLL